MRRNRSGGKTASIEAAFARELYDLRFHSSSLKALEAGNHPFRDLMVREAGRVYHQICRRFVERSTFGQQSSDGSFRIGCLQEGRSLISTNRFKKCWFIRFQSNSVTQLIVQS